ncbi:hypothetical protein HYU15_01675 [Candidatus Woesearchaeota archaeon]|nr:hypothetical protein [Candidatus Woesearchaeota archaeon]
MNAQVSTEYLVIVGFALLLTIPTIVLFFSQSTQTVEQVAASEAKQIARKIVDNAEKVYYLGKPATTTITVSMPRNIESIGISNREVRISIRGSAGVSDIVEVSSVNITGNLSAGSGVRSIRIENLGGNVNVSYVS